MAGGRGGGAGGGAGGQNATVQGGSGAAGRGATDGGGGGGAGQIIFQGGSVTYGGGAGGDGGGGTSGGDVAEENGNAGTAASTGSGQGGGGGSGAGAFYSAIGSDNGGLLLGDPASDRPGFTGGDGGAGDGAGSGGGGGSGGAYASVDGGKAQLEIFSSQGSLARGGAGGAGGAAGGAANSSGGDGGDGGDGVELGSGHSLTIDSGVEASGGTGGKGGSGGTSGTAGRQGAGGAGVVGTSITVTVQDGASLSGGAGSTTGDAATFLSGTNVLNYGGTITGDLAIVAQGSTLQIDAAAGGSTVGNVITGAGGIIQNSANTLTLTGANTYTGGTTLSAGTLELAAQKAAGSATGGQTAGGVAFGATGTTLQIDGAAFAQATQRVQAARFRVLDTQPAPSTSGTYASPVTNFAPGETLHLRDLAYTAGATTAAYDGASALTVTDGAAIERLTDFTLAGGAVPSGYRFATSADANGGTDVTLAAIPATPAAPTLAASSDTGPSDSDGVTDDTTPTFTGTAAAGALVRIFDGQTVIGSQQLATGATTYSVQTAGLTANAVDAITATQTVGGVESAMSAATNVTLDTTPPAVAIDGQGGTVATARQTVTGTVADANPGQTVSLFDDGSTTAFATATLQADGTFSAPVTLAEGANSVTAQDTDLAGNVGTSAPVVYTYAPPAPVSTGGGAPAPSPAPVTPTPVSPAPFPAAPAPVAPSPVTPSPVPVAPGSGGVTPAGTVSLSPQVFYADGTFTLTGTATGGGTVAIAAAVDGGSAQSLGTAAVDPDGIFTVRDAIGAESQGFITATLTNGSGASAQADGSLTGGLGPQGVAGRQTRYSADGSAETAVTRFRPDGSERVSVLAGFQSFESWQFDTFHNRSAPNTTFVFDPGHGLDVVDGFRPDNTDHDTLSFLGSDFGSTPASQLAGVLNNTRDTGSGAVVFDPTSKDTVLLTGITKQQLADNPGDYAFHG